jgi:hypothetical protein
MWPVCRSVVVLSERSVVCLMIDSRKHTHYSTSCAPVTCARIYKTRVARCEVIDHYNESGWSGSKQGPVMAFCENSFTTAGELTSWLLAADGLCSLGLITLWCYGIRLAMGLQLRLYYVLADSMSCPVDNVLRDSSLKKQHTRFLFCRNYYAHTHTHKHVHIHTHVNTDVHDTCLITGIYLYI